jgi:hypothetical protein
MVGSFGQVLQAQAKGTMPWSPVPSRYSAQAMNVQNPLQGVPFGYATKRRRIAGRQASRGCMRASEPSSNPSIEATSNIWLRQQSAAPHVKR